MSVRAVREDDVVLLVFQRREKGIGGSGRSSFLNQGLQILARTGFELQQLDRVDSLIEQVAQMCRESRNLDVIQRPMAIIDGVQVTRFDLGLSCRADIRS